MAKCESEDYTCANCGGSLCGDGYTMPVHCETLDIVGQGYEVDSGPIYCPGRGLKAEAEAAWHRAMFGLPV